MEEVEGFERIDLGKRFPLRQPSKTGAVAELEEISCDAKFSRGPYASPGEVVFLATREK